MSSSNNQKGQAPPSPKANNARSPPQSPRSSFLQQFSHGQSPPGARRYSLNLPPEMIRRLEQRRASLEKLQLDKISPWMHLYDFTENETETTTASGDGGKTSE